MPSSQPTPVPDHVPSLELPHRVVAAELDAFAHVNNVVYLQWIQDIASAHWQAIAPAGAVESIRWYALRHEIDYLKAAVLDDQLILRTWVGKAERLSFERHTEVLSASDRSVLCRARTLWCPIDAASGRPSRVPAEVRALFST